MADETIKQQEPAVTAEEIARARAGDREAMTRIYEATSLEIYRTIHALLRDEQTVLDVQQEVYVQAFSHLDGLREPEKLLPWLRQIAVNRVRMELRRSRPLLFTELSGDTDAPEPEFPDEEAASPELTLDRKETSRLVREILDGLPDGQRLLIGMYYYEQMPVKTIAEDLGVSEGSVKTQLHRGRKRVEAEVRRLEEQGVKLYGLSPLPFLAALLGRLFPAQAAEEKVLTGALERTGGGAVLQTARPFLQTALGRLVIGLGIAAAIAGGLAGKKWLDSHHLQKPGPEPETAENVLFLPTVEDEDSTEPPGPLVPTAPDLPDPTAPEPPTEPPDLPAVTEPKVTEPPVTEPTATQPPDEEPKDSSPEEQMNNSTFQQWSWASGVSSMDRDDLRRGTSDILRITVIGEEKPDVYSDASGIVQLTYLGRITAADPLEGGFEYQWNVYTAVAGTAHVYCALGGTVARSLTIRCTEETDAASQLTLVDWTQWDGGSETATDAMLAAKRVGVSDYLRVGMVNVDAYSLSTDAPDVVSVRRISESASESGKEALYQITTVGYGTAQLLITMDGETVTLFTIGVPRDPPRVNWMQWDEEVPKDFTVDPYDYIFFSLEVEGSEAPYIHYPDSSSDSIRMISVTQVGLPGDRILIYRYAAQKSYSWGAIVCELNGEVAASLPLRFGG